MRTLIRVSALLAFVCLSVSLAGILEDGFAFQPGFDPAPLVQPSASTRGTVLGSFDRQYWGEGWMDANRYTAVHDDLGRVSNVYFYDWNSVSDEWEPMQRLNLHYRPDYRPLHAEIEVSYNGEWEPVGDVNYFYENDLLQAIFFYRVGDNGFEPFYQVAFFYYPTTGILEKSVELYYFSGPIPRSVRKYEYAWDAGCRPYEIIEYAMSDMGDWGAVSRHTYVYHNDDQTTQASYMRRLEFGWPLIPWFATGVQPSKLLEDRQYYKGGSSGDWVESYRYFYIYEGGNDLQRVDTYTNTGQLGWQLDWQRSYTYENGLPVTETYFDNEIGQTEMLPQERFVFSYTQVTANEDPVVVPATMSLRAYPNPFNPLTSISYKLESPDQTEIAVYNLKGQKVRTLLNAEAKAGTHSVIWDGRDENGRSLANGIYIVRMVSGREARSIKVILAK